MEIVSSILEIILILMTVALGVLLPLAIVFNVKAGRKYRKQLAKNIHNLRLNKMLAALGIDTAEYLHSERVVDIHEQMTRCGECQNIETCDETLAGEVDADKIEFCNNETALRALVNKNRAA
jgi:hypothetical protein